MSVSLRRLPLLGACVLALGAQSAVSAIAAPQPEEAAIVNGTTVSEADFAAKWPFLVAIVSATEDTQYNGQFCGGALIDDQHVVTAAHCLTFDNGIVSAAAGLKVVAKTRSLSFSGMGSGETGARAVSDVFIEPDFGENAGKGFRNDIAVLRLVEPVAAASTIALVQPSETALWGGGAGGPNAFVAGWGDTDPLDRNDPDLKYPSVLRQTTVPLRSDVVCSTTAGGYGTAFERATNLCAGTLQSGSQLGTDSCRGDSGGPLTVAVGDGTFRLAGIVSWGEGCAERRYGAYARVDALRGWVNSIPGATDGGAPVGGPGGTLAIGNLRRTSGDYTHVQLGWDAPTGGAAPERYAVWRRVVEQGERAEQLVGITDNLSFRASVPPTRRTAAYVWNVRPLDARGSNGPSTTLKAGPTPDTIAPTAPRVVGLVRRSSRALVVRWSASSDRQTGIDGYQVQRRVVGRGGFVTVNFTSAFPRTSAITRLPAGATVRVRVRAWDRAGNPGPWRMATFRTLR